MIEFEHLCLYFYTKTISKGNFFVSFFWTETRQYWQHKFGYSLTENLWILQTIKYSRPKIFDQNNHNNILIKENKRPIVFTFHTFSF